MNLANSAAVNWAPALSLLLLAAGLALLPLAWWAWRQRRASPRQRLAALTALTLMLTLDLIVFGAFTRLTDSGLGCPDWPGCYGHLSPWAAQTHIAQAELAQPGGPVTLSKAWVEMLHRYLAMVVGALILSLALLSVWWRRQLPHALFWPWATLVWVLVQGAFGKYTVTLKLYPAIVSAHWLGALVLLALLVFQHEAYRQSAAVVLSRGARCLLAACALALLVQVSLGAWVSTNYAVLACQGFPQCNGQWWPALSAADVAQGFSPLRALGHTSAAHGGGLLPFSALVAIHLSHRLMALLLSVLLLALVWRLWRAAPGHARALLALWALQVASGLGNVVLNWPLAGALLHSAGAALWVGTLVSLACRVRGERVVAPAVNVNRLPPAADLAGGMCP